MDALLIYPTMGNLGNMVVDLPLSIIYAATDSVKAGYDVGLVDLRCEQEDWRIVLRPLLAKKPRLVGISVMTGIPLKNARDIALFIKADYPGIPVVWGGPHVTVLPETIDEQYLDFLIRGYGSVPLKLLLDELAADQPDFSRVPGLSWRDNGAVVHNDRPTTHESISFRDLPYHLLDITGPGYQRAYLGRRVFPMFTAIGCPYRCSFCVHPTIYRVIAGKKWLPYPEEEVLDHMQFLKERHGASHLCIIDDTSFPDIERMRRIFNGVIERKLDLILEFRGARINEIDRMDDDFLELMADAGGRMIMVGVESCSDRILKVMQKGITAEQIIRVNRKLARHPRITAHYNLIYGTPGETYDDLVATKNVVLKMIEDNKNAYFGFGGDWKPIPGSKMLDMAKAEYGFEEPRTMDEWIAMDSSEFKDKIRHPWYSNRHNNLIKMLQVTSFVIDDKLIKETKENKRLVFRIIRLLSSLYKPVAKFRLKHDLHQCFIEYDLWVLAMKLLPFVTGSRNKGKDAKGRRPDHPLRFSVHTRLREDHLRRLIPADPTGVLLDVGCGLGYLTAVLGQGFKTVFGLEYDLGGLRSLRRLAPGAIPLCGKAWELPLADASVDVAVCTEVFEHLPGGFDEKALAEIRRVLKPGGRLYLTVPCLEGLRATSRLRNLGHDNPAGGEYHYRQGYRAEEITRMAERVGGLAPRGLSYSMPIVSELFMDLLKLVYFRKNTLKEHSDIESAGDSALFRAYRKIFPALFSIFVLEDAVLAPALRGHILIAQFEKV